jgi:hypothetical protein
LRFHPIALKSLTKRGNDAPAALPRLGEDVAKGWCVFIEHGNRISQQCFISQNEYEASGFTFMLEAHDDVIGVLGTLNSRSYTEHKEFADQRIAGTEPI